MKDSGIEWIGEIPDDWFTIRCKYIAETYTGNSIKDDEKCDFEDSTDALPYISTKNINSITYLIDKSDILYIKQDDLRFVRASKGDTLMCIEGGSAGKKKTYLHECVCFVNKLCCFHPVSINSKFLYYILHSPHYESEFDLNLSGLIGGVSRSKLNNFILPFPSKDIQQRIADYLDKKCAAVDRLMENQRLQIEKLKEYKQSVITEAVTKGIDKTVPLKSSGVEWIGDIPSKWFIGKKLAYYVADSISYGIVKLLEPDDKNGVKVLRCSDVLEGYIEKQNIRTVTQKVSKEYTRTILKAGDIVVNVRGSLGGCAVVPIEMEGFNIAREVALIRLTSKLYNRFVMYYLLSNSFVNYRTRFLAGSVYIGLNIELLSSMPIVIPPLSEQQQIAEYLDKKCAEIDGLISIKQQKIEKLTEYKKSLIYEYVTGKKQVG